MLGGHGFWSLVWSMPHLLIYYIMTATLYNYYIQLLTGFDGGYIH